MVENTLVSPFLAIHLLVKNVKELFFIVAGSLDNKIKSSLSVIHLRLRYITATNTCFSQNCIFFFLLYFAIVLTIQFVESLYIKKKYKTLCLF